MGFTRLGTEIQAEEYYVSEEKRLEGNPLQKLWIEYTDSSERFCAGIWQSEKGKWRVSYSEEEYCHILEGISIVTEDGKDPIQVNTGDRFVISAGFQGSWEVVEPTRKHFVVYEK
ncbi:cupin domain-containing protein [uncultured Amphritea sp.]|uniref:cupin domain-containing protein n=1 Tax=uncultured Amphritea sp. TaxID=981605 RepID=UPI002633DB27|nr:cupin domain-containing protein [uncultured Amphritea sp.]